MKLLTLAWVVVVLGGVAIRLLELCALAIL